MKKKVVMIQEQREKNKQIETVHDEIKKEVEKKEEKKRNEESILENLKNRFTPEQGEQIREMLKRAQMNISRWYLETARWIVIEWLAMKKNDKELNIVLAEIYEREKKYQNAAYVYQDLLEIHKDDEVILQKLGNSLFLLWDTQGAFDIYIQAHKKNRSHTEILDILAHLALDLRDYKAGIKYANLYLKEKPRNAEKLGIKWYCLEKLGRISESIETYQRILEVQPYNSEIHQRIKLLEEKKEEEKG